MAKIMIIDDELPVREALGAMVAAAGHETCLVSDGSHGLSQLASFQPDLVITDILMPGMEGMETIHTLRKRQPTLPIIAMSGGQRFHGLDYLSTAKRMGASHSISKPVSPRTLMDAVTDLLGGTARALPLR